MVVVPQWELMELIQFLKQSLLLEAARELGLGTLKHQAAQAARAVAVALGQLGPQAVVQGHQIKVTQVEVTLALLPARTLQAVAVAVAVSALTQLIHQLAEMAEMEFLVQ
jgi:hypothetical protein